MLSTIYALLCIIVPCSLYQLIICKRQNKKQENKAIHFVWVYIFLLYIYLTFSVAGIGSIWDIGHYDTIIRCFFTKLPIVRAMKDEKSPMNPLFSPTNHVIG